MLSDLIMELVTATEKQDKERAYRRLERVGVDRISADAMAREFSREMKGGKKIGRETSEAAR